MKGPSEKLEEMLKEHEVPKGSGVAVLNIKDFVKKVHFDMYFTEVYQGWDFDE